MKISRQIIVFDAPDMASEAAFWAGVIGGRVVDDDDDDWLNVVDANGDWFIGVQLAPNLTPPDWPDGTPQQIHLDLHVDDLASAHDEVMALGARLLKAADDPDADAGFQVYADPAGHPFCLCWGS
jgi:predicted enzyme related to lactoylglutathione lyase